jgi:hypothetical protein
MRFSHLDYFCGKIISTPGCGEGRRRWTLAAIIGDLGLLASSNVPLQ